MIIPPKLFTEARKDYDLCDVEALSKWAIELGLQYQPEVRESFERLVDILGTQQFYKEFTSLYQYIMGKEQEKQSTFASYDIWSQPAPLTRTPSSTSAASLPSNHSTSNVTASAFKTLSESEASKNISSIYETASATSALLCIIPGKANIIKNYPSFAYRKYAKTPYSRHHSQPQFKADLRFSSPPNIMSSSAPSSNSPRHLPLRGWQFRSFGTDQTPSNIFQVASLVSNDDQKTNSPPKGLERAKTMPLPTATGHSSLLPIAPGHTVLKRDSVDDNDDANYLASEFVSSVQITNNLIDEAQTSTRSRTSNK